MLCYFSTLIEWEGTIRKMKYARHWEFKDAMITPPRSPEKVHHEIAAMLANGVNYIDALVEYARINELEIEAVADIVKKSTILKEKLRTEAVKLRMVQKENVDITELCE
jgi:predicted aldo/keto reductase-like oxidoreductase